MRRLAIGAACVAFSFASACSKKEPAKALQPAGPRVPESMLQGKLRTRFDSPNPTAAQLARKQRSLAIVKEMNLPWLDSLPVIEDEAAIKARSTTGVSTRCLATAFTAIKGESNDQKLVDGFIQKYSARSFFSPQELDFLDNARPSREQLTDFSWRYECVHVFLWALGFLPRLNPPNQQCVVKDDISIILDRGPERFAADAKLRPLAEVLDQADLYYRLHWAADEFRLKQQKNSTIDGEITSERLRALNWLIRYQNQSWDDVSTDT